MEKKKVNTKNSKYFSLTSTKSAHSVKICLIVITVSHATQRRGRFFSFFFYINECVK